MREQEERDRILSSDGLVARSAFQRGESDEVGDDCERGCHPAYHDCERECHLAYSPTRRNSRTSCRCSSEHRKRLAGMHSMMCNIHTSHACTRVHMLQATEDDETESDLVGAGILPVDLMTRVACTNIGWEGEGFVGLSRGDMKVCLY
jgi:hypothetical protein